MSQALPSSQHVKSQLCYRAIYEKKILLWIQIEGKKFFFLTYIKWIWKS